MDCQKSGRAKFGGYLLARDGRRRLIMRSTYSASSRVNLRLQLKSLLSIAVLACLFAYNAVGVQAQMAPSMRRTLMSSPAKASRAVGRMRRARRRLPRGRSIASLLGGMKTTLSATASTQTLASDTSDSDTAGTGVESFAENPQWRLNWFLFQRTYPADIFASRGRSVALTLAEGLLSQAAPLATPTPPITERWRSIGPTPIHPRFPSMGVTGGRLTSVVVSPADPRIVLVGSATGGIWRSTDRGNTFEPVSDDQVDLAVGAIAFAPSDPSIVYAGMGDVAGGYMGTGVLKSVDGGASWTRVDRSGLPPPGTIANIVVDTADSKRVYATQYSYRPANGEGQPYASGFFISEDGGETWRKTKTGLPKDLVHHPTKPQTLYLSMISTFAKTPPSAGVYKSPDGGKTWQPIFVRPYLNATDVKITVTPAEPETIYVLTGLISKASADVSLHVSKNGGQTWTHINNSRVDVGQFGYNSYIAADPTDARTLYLGTRDLWKSVNGGQTWNNITNNWKRFGDRFLFVPDRATSHTDQHTIAFSPVNSQVIYIGNDGGLSRSSDGGRTFESLNATLSTAQLNSITLHPASTEISCGGSQDNGVLMRAPNQSQWTEFESGDSGKCLINPTDPDMIFTSYVFGTLYRFRKSGSQFVRTLIANEDTFSEPPDEPRIGFYPPLAYNLSSGEIYFGTWRLFVGSNQAVQWDDPSDGKDLTMGVSDRYGADVLSAIGVGPAGSNVIYTGSAQGRLMVSGDNGRSWKDVTEGLPRRFVTSIVVAPTDGNKAYVTFSGFASGHIFHTTDGGVTWNDISADIPNIPVNALLIDPTRSETLYAGTDIGVFRSLDDGQNWHRFNNGMPPVIVTGFAAQPTGAIQLSTYGRGAYELIR